MSTIDPKRIAFELRGLGKDTPAIAAELNKAAWHVESYADRIDVLEAERDRARELLKVLEYLTDPEDKFDSAINPGPERDELQRAYDAYKGIKR